MSRSVAVITGGAGDIGRAIAAKLSRSGMYVSIWDIKPQPEIDRVLRELGGESPQCLGIHCDVTKPEDLSRALLLTHERLGPVNILVNAVGIMFYRPFIETPDTEWDQVVRVNLLGPMNAIRTVLPDMITAKNGVIVNICSIWSTHTGPMRCAYIASKWGLLGATRALAEELRQYRIRVCAVSPGPVDTAMTAAFVEEKERRTWLKPDHVADVVTFAVSPEADGIVGGEIQVFGWAKPKGV